MTKHLSRGLAAFLPALVLLAAGSARAESGRFNLHFSGLGPLPSAGEASLDWQLAPPFALELRAGGGVDPFVQGDPAGLFYAMAGARFRFFDDESGYLDEGGSVAGHLWAVAAGGLFVFGAGPDVGAGFIADASVGYAFSIVNPVSISPFVRGGFAAADDGSGFTELRGFFAGGIEVSIEIDPIRHPRLDTDGDGVYDDRDRCPGTAPGTQVDGAGCPDTDRDGVFDHTDACPDTPLGSAVDERGCVPLPPRLVLDGIVFELGSAAILSESERTLLGALSALLDNPDVRIEIEGHTDDIGGAAPNLELSRLRADSVRSWLVAHGVDASRLEIRGYGMTRPRVPNTDEASRAQNRRIEFRQLD